MQRIRRRLIRYQKDVLGPALVGFLCSDLPSSLLIPHFLISHSSYPRTLRVLAVVLTQKSGLTLSSPSCGDFSLGEGITLDYVSPAYY